MKFHEFEGEIAAYLKEAESQDCWITEQTPPLYLLNNKIVDTELLSSLDPGRIDSINVMHCKEAFLQFGEKGRQGAIFIYGATLYAPEEAHKNE